MKVKKMAVPIAILVMVVAVIFTVALTPAMAADPSDVCKDSIRLYGTFGEGAGNQSIACENKPYTDPEAPFFPQHPQAPRKDFMTFDPAIMDHDQGYPELIFYECSTNEVETGKEKVFKRMWYEKEWFKDKNENGVWDVVIDTPYGLDVRTLAEWNAKPEWEKVAGGESIVEWNNPEGKPDEDGADMANADIYAPAIVQEFTYFFTDEDIMPMMIAPGSQVLIPMAHNTSNPYRGLNSFDADGNASIDGVRDALTVESEATLNIDIDGDGTNESMNPDGLPLNGDETVVLTLRKSIDEGESIQFFDTIVEVDTVSDFGHAIFNFKDNEGGDSQRHTNYVTLGLEEVVTLHRAMPGISQANATFYLKLKTADAADNYAVVEVGRMFGQAHANIGISPDWNQKAFMVDEVLYSVAAVMTGPITEPVTENGDCIKYITIREKLPKFPIKIYGKHLEVWKPAMMLPEMAPFCEDHEVIVDVLTTQSIPQDQQDKIGEKIERPPLNITYDEEDIEERFNGSLLEILDETLHHLELRPKDTVTWEIIEDGAWGRMAYTSAGPCFSYCFEGDGLTPGREYSLIYYADEPDRFVNWGGNNPGKLIGTGTATAAGTLGISDCPTLGMDLPCWPDWNINPVPDYCDYHNGLDDYCHCSGAKIWLVPSDDYSEPTVTSWNNASKFLFETDLITYKETDEWPEDERWNVEWFHTYPHQYTNFILPPPERVLVTLSWIAPEAETTIWDGDDTKPLANYTYDRVKFWYEDCTGYLYVNESDSSIRLYGTFGEGAGDQSIPCENKPYTCPEGPFFPQHGQTPAKDFMTFNPAIMDHDQGYPELIFYECSTNEVETGKEKVFKRMWYEKEWFKDKNENGVWDVVIDTPYGLDVRTLAEWNAKPEWEKVAGGESIVEWNNPEGKPDEDGADMANADIYAPAIVQEFTYFFTDEDIMPMMIAPGSQVLIPMAHNTSNPYRGLNSFDADGNASIDGVRDALTVESEATLNIDIDGDGTNESMNPDGLPLNGDETVVLTLRKSIDEGESIQFFDTIVEVDTVSDFGHAIFNFKDNEGGDSQRHTNYVTLGLEEVVTLHRAMPGISQANATFYLKLKTADAADNYAVVEVGRMFGQAHANIGISPDWNQKAFMVDEVLYSVAAVMTGPITEPVTENGDCIKYITIREKLPKFPIKIYGKHLEVWEPGEMLPEPAPFCMDHEILVDILPTQSIPQNQQDKIGKKVPRPPLVINYTEEDIEPRFKGSLLEILDEPMKLGPNFMVDSCELTDEQWMVEWFHTYPEQYTAFRLPAGELYLMTLGWFAPEAETTIWDCDPDGPIKTKTGDRAKFWYDPTDPTDIYVTKTDGGGPVTPVCKGDSTGDDYIDFDDFMDFLDAYEKHSGETGYNEVFDFDEPIDGYIDFGDFMEFLDVYETSCP